MSFPKKGMKLFVQNGEYYDFAHFAWGSAESQFYGYIEGYKRSADVIINNALRKKRIDVLDTCVFPACFLYRQYVELTLKHLYLGTAEEKTRTIKQASHDLKSIWKKVRPIIEGYYPTEDPTPLLAAEDYILQFAEEDKSSFAFRYPITKNLSLVHGKQRWINLRNLATRMAELESFLTGVQAGMEAMKDIEDEMKAYYAQEGF